MTEWRGNAVPGARPQLDDDAARQARHDLFTTLLGAYADGELPAETMAQVDAHLLGCERCRREVSMQQAIAQSLQSRFGGTAVPAMPDGLRARVLALTTTMPEPGRDAGSAAAAVRAAEGRRAFTWRHGLAVGALVLVTTVGAVTVVAPRVRASRAAGSVVVAPVPVALSSNATVLDRIADDFRRIATRELPGRARDLDAVRSAVHFPVQPLVRDDAQLVAAWTVDLDGELVAVMAYRWHDRLLLQYRCSDAVLFRSAEVRAAFADGRAAVGQRGAAGMVAWSAPEGGSVVVASVPWQELLALQSTASPSAAR